MAERVCVDCGSTPPRGPRSLRCAECYSEDKRRRHRESERRRRESKPLEMCARCGKRPRKSHRARYCAECAPIARREVVRAANRRCYGWEPNEDCTRCGRKIVNRGSHAKYCNHCAKLMQREWSAAYAAKLRAKQLEPIRRAAEVAVAQLSELIDTPPESFDVGRVRRIGHMLSNATVKAVSSNRRAA